jgi:hypothetical protein
MPLWLTIALVVLVAVALTLFMRKWRGNNTKHDLSVVVLPTPPPRWSIGAMKDVPYLSLHFHARLAHTHEHPLEIVNGYLEGTEGVAPFPPLFVSGRFDGSTMIHLGVRPILADSGNGISRRVVLIDQFGKKHRTNKLTFRESQQPNTRFGPNLSAIACFFCGKSIAMEELHESAAIPAHKNCVK